MIDELIETIGPAATRKLIARWGGSEIWVPKSFTPDRDAKVIRALQTKSYADVAREFGLHPSTVFRIAKRIART